MSLEDLVDCSRFFMFDGAVPMCNLMDQITKFFSGSKSNLVTRYGAQCVLKRFEKYEFVKIIRSEEHGFLLEKTDRGDRLFRSIEMCRHFIWNLIAASGRVGIEEYHLKEIVRPLFPDLYLSVFISVLIDDHVAWKHGVIRLDRLLHDEEIDELGLSRFAIRYLTTSYRLKSYFSGKNRWETFDKAKLMKNKELQRELSIYGVSLE